MLCAISGEAPQTPVASRKSGTVFERRLIEAYIRENGRDPVTGEELSVDDLVELKAARAVKPRPPALTSIPALLATFQGEWDALALETFTLRQHLAQLRQELSAALYNNDAAVRVIARLTKERDDARDALAKVTMQDRRAAGAANGAGAEAMQVDAPTLPESVVARIDETKDRLSKTRRKRPVPVDWVTPDAVSDFSPAPPVEILPLPGCALAVDASNTVALLAGSDGSCCTFALDSQEMLHSFKVGSGPVNDALLFSQDDKKLSVIASSNGEINLVDGDAIVNTFAAHSGAVTGLAVHPSGAILASVGTDKSVAIFDLTIQKEVTRITTDSPLLCCHFHPDGHLLAVGTNRSQINIYDTKSLTIAAEFATPGAVQSLCFSENGFWLAAAYSDASTVGIWDLRKMAEIKSLDFGGRVSRVCWDYTGQYLAGAGPDGVAVQSYDKSSKSWSEPWRQAVAAVAVEWGSQAKSLVILTLDGAVSLVQ